MNEETRTAVPVPGEVIARPTVKTVGGVLFVTLIFFASAFIVWAYFTESALPLPSAEFRVNGLGAILAGLGLLITPLMILFLGFMLFVRERIILGDDRLQRLQRGDGKDKVTTQIPYRNISTLVCGRIIEIPIVGAAGE